MNPEYRKRLLNHTSSTYRELCSFRMTLTEGKGHVSQIAALDELEALARHIREAQAAMGRAIALLAYEHDTGLAEALAAPPSEPMDPADKWKAGA